MADIQNTSYIFIITFNRYNIALSSVIKVPKCLLSILVFISLYIGNKKFINYSLRITGLDDNELFISNLC